MRRSKLFSNLAVVGLAALMVAWFAVGVRGLQGPKPCLNGCGKGQKPPGCCEEPTCQLYTSLLIDVIVERAWSKGNFPKALLGSLNTSANVDRANAQYTAATTPELMKFVDCPGYKSPTPFHVTKSCAVVTPNTKEVKSVDEAKAISPDCPEIAEAEYEAAELEQSECLADAMNKTEIFTIEEIRARQEGKYLRKIMSLQQSFTQFWMSCIAFWDSETAKAVEDAFTNALKPPMPSKPPAKVPARAVRSGRGR